MLAVVMATKASRKNFFILTKCYRISKHDVKTVRGETDVGQVVRVIVKGLGGTPRGIALGVRSAIARIGILSTMGQGVSAGSTVGMCCRYQRPWPAWTMSMSPEDGSPSMSAEVKLYGEGKIHACADKTTGVNAKKTTNNLVFIILLI